MENKNFNIKEFFLGLFAKKKPEPVNTALMRERMQPHTIEKLETIGRELKERKARFLGSGVFAPSALCLWAQAFL